MKRKRIYHISNKIGKERRKRRKEKQGKRKEEKEERKGLREMNSGVNASLRFAFTSIVEKGAFYNKKQVRKESKGVCLSKGVKSKKGCLFIIKRVLSKKGVKSKKGCLFIKRVFVLSKVSNQRKGVHEKRKRGKRKTKRKPKHVFKRRGCDNKTNTKKIKQILYQNKL